MGAPERQGLLYTTPACTPASPRSHNLREAGNGALTCGPRVHIQQVQEACPLAAGSGQELGISVPPVSPSKAAGGGGRVAVSHTPESADPELLLLGGHHALSVELKVSDWPTGNLPTLEISAFVLTMLENQSRGCQAARGAPSPRGQELPLGPTLVLEF